MLNLPLIVLERWILVRLMAEVMEDSPVLGFVKISKIFAMQSFFSVGRCFFDRVYPQCVYAGVC